MEGLVGIVALIAAASLRPEALLRHQRRPATRRRMSGKLSSSTRLYDRSCGDADAGATSIAVST